jgi:hypothetical protein
MTDYQVLRAYHGEVLVAAPGADPVHVGGEWRTSKDQKDYFWTPRTTGKEPDVFKYKRSSKAGEYLKGSSEKLVEFNGCMTAVGLMMSKDLQSEVANLINEYNGDPYYKGDDGGWKSGKSRLKDVVKDAGKRGGNASASALGTEFHKLGETVNKGEEPYLVRDELVEPLEEYKRRVSPIKFLRQEILIVNDVIRRAGSIDYLMELPAGLTTPDGVTHTDPLVVAGDLKTGKWDARYPAGLTAQLYAYGGGSRYNQETNERLPLHENFNDRWAVLVHYPLAVKGSTVNFYWVDLRVGRHVAELNNRYDEMIKYFESDKGKPVLFELPEVRVD